MTRLILLILIFPLGISCSINLYEILINLLSNLDNNLFFIVGSLFSIVIVWMFKKKLQFFTTFEHELTHNFWAILFFRKPMGFHVKKDGTGLFEYKAGGKFSNIFISLSPYFFPTACFIWLPFYGMCKSQYLWLYFLVMGIFFGYHIMSTIQETGSYQTDISNNGVFYSYLILIPLNIIFNGIILAHLDRGFHGVFDFLYSGHLNNYHFIVSLLNL